MDNLIIIPALNPNEKLIKLVKDLQNSKINNILVVDDGSSSLDIFNELEKQNIKVIHHNINKGKGVAIKTALKEYDKYFNDIKGFITADADGQHSVEDIVNINNLLKNDIIFGVRNFKEKNVPFRSKFGNKFSSIFFYLNTGIKLNDTQTGLRGFPIKYKDLLLSISGDRFEYEMNVLNKLGEDKIYIKQIPIKTIYENNNKSSNFKAIKDSFKIYSKFFKYSIISLLSAIIDLSLFTIFLKTNNILLSTIMARVISGIFNFIFNKSYSFKSNNNVYKEGTRYLLLFILIMFISASTVEILDIIPINTTIIKLVIDTILFVINYYIQKKYIFGGDKNKK